jgi:hypothetical protein
MGTIYIENAGTVEFPIHEKPAGDLSHFWDVLLKVLYAAYMLVSSVPLAVGQVRAKRVGEGLPVKL